MSTGPSLLLAGFLLVANAFFVGAEFALVSARRTSVEPRAAAGGKRAQMTLAAMDQVSLMMAGAQLGITICSLGLGYLGEPAIAHLLEDGFEGLGLPDALLHPLAFAIALSLIGFLHVVLGEMVPKNLALAGPDRAAMLLGPPLAGLVRVLHPVIALLNFIANTILRLAGVQPRDDVASTFTRDEVAGMLGESRREGLLDSDEERLLRGALVLEARDARAVLLASEDLATLAPDVTPRDIERAAAETGFSRFPVRRDDRLVGYLHVKDALAVSEADHDQSIPGTLVRPMPTVEHSDRLRSVLQAMQRSDAHMAEVRGPGGEQLGVAALEDVLEELVGEIRDESAPKTP